MRIMRALPRTIEVVDDDMARILRAKTPAERLVMIDQLCLFARELAESGVRATHPDWSDEQVRKEVARRIAHDVDEFDSECRAELVRLVAV